MMPAVSLIIFVVNEFNVVNVQEKFGAIKHSDQILLWLNE